MQCLNIIPTQYLWLRSLDLWQCYINTIIVILDIIHRPVIYLKHNFSELFPGGTSTGLRERGTSSIDWDKLSRYHLET
jgi:hypothetical protein